MFLGIVIKPGFSISQVGVGSKVRVAEAPGLFPIHPGTQSPAPHIGPADGSVRLTGVHVSTLDIQLAKLPVGTEGAPERLIERQQGFSQQIAAVGMDVAGLFKILPAPVLSEREIELRRPELVSHSQFGQPQMTIMPTVVVTPPVAGNPESLLSVDNAA